MPVTPEIEITGVEQLNAKLQRLQQRLDTDDPGSTVRRVMSRAVIRVQAGMMHYPPQRAGSWYRRTGTLGRRWTTEIINTGDGLVGKVGNNTEYGPMVQSELFQANVHAGTWQTDRDVMDKEEPEIQREFAALVRDAVREFA